jgi:hypothetical protein
MAARIVFAVAVVNLTFLFTELFMNVVGTLIH